VYPKGRSSDDDFTDPVARIDHDELAALVGGFVYRGKRIPALYGKYVFGDLISGRIYYVDAEDLQLGQADAKIQRAILMDAKNVEQTFEHFAGRPRTELRFGMDAAGELYVLAKANGSIWSVRE